MVEAWSSVFSSGFVRVVEITQSRTSMLCTLIAPTLERLQKLFKLDPLEMPVTNLPEFSLEFASGLTCHDLSRAFSQNHLSSGVIDCRKGPAADKPLVPSCFCR